jgi:hypothetical protein
MARKKTLEELRAGARVRSQRWRDKNRATHRERVLELYGRAKAQGFFVGSVRPEELIRLDQAMKKGGTMDQSVTDNVIYGPIAGYDEPMEPRERGGRGGIFKGVGQADERGVGPKDGRGPVQETANEEATYRRLGELRERQARGGLNALAGPGVEVDVDVEV